MFLVGEADLEDRMTYSAVWIHLYSVESSVIELARAAQLYTGPQVLAGLTKVSLSHVCC